MRLELEFLWTLEFSEGDYKGQNLLMENFVILLESSWNVDV